MCSYIFFFFSEYKIKSVFILKNTFIDKLKTVSNKNRILRFIYSTDEGDTDEVGSDTVSGGSLTAGVLYFTDECLALLLPICEIRKKLQLINKSVGNGILFLPLIA